MTHFVRGMACCNPQRLRVGLQCDVEHQLTCAASALKWRAEYRPAELPQLVRSVLAAFPEHLSYLRLIAREAGVLDVFVEQAALLCAALATKVERQAYRAALIGEYGSHAHEARLTSGLSHEQIATFDTLMSAEWHRLRGKPVPGVPK